MPFPQTLDDTDRHLVALWAAHCTEHVLPLFEAEVPDDDRARDGVERAGAYGHGELDPAGEIERRFNAGRAPLSMLPLLGENSSGPLGTGLLASGVIATTIREI